MKDPGAATGQMPYEPSRCECGELVTLHVISEGGERKACSASTCDCRRFVAAQEVARA